LPETIQGKDRTRPKRDAILDAARTLFTQKGYEDTTIADLAREARVAVGTVYLYFHNKHEVYTAVALDIDSKLAQVFEDPIFLQISGRDLVQEMVNATFRTCHEHSELMKLLRLDIQSEAEVKLYKHSTNRLTAAIEKVLRHAVDRGQLRPFNTAIYAQFLNLFGEGILQQCFGIENGEHEELYRQYLIEFLERVFIGPSLLPVPQDEDSHNQHLPVQ